MQIILLRQEKLEEKYLIRFEVMQFCARCFIEFQSRMCDAQDRGKTFSENLKQYFSAENNIKLSGLKQVFINTFEV